MRSSTTLLVLLAIFACFALTVRAGSGKASLAKWWGIDAIHDDRAKAVQQTIVIINQPVASLPRTGAAGVFSPGWFHPGAETPDFDTADIRTTQEFPYDQYRYVTSDVTPNTMFEGRQLEFNAMTKYFYVDRDLPKKRLTEAEMEQVNLLYREIGRDDHALTRIYIGLGVMVGGIIVVLGLLWLFLREPR